MTAFKNNLRQIRPLLYRLKRSYGRSLQLNRPTAYTANLETGVSSRSYQIIAIRRAIVLPAREIRDFSYDLSYIAANKNFTYGGFFDESSSVVIIDNKDLPDGFTPTINDYLVIDDRRWNIGSIDAAQANYGFVLTVKQIAATKSVT